MVQLGLLTPHTTSKMQRVQISGKLLSVVLAEVQQQRYSQVPHLGALLVLAVFILEQMIRMAMSILSLVTGLNSARGTLILKLAISTSQILAGLNLQPMRHGTSKLTTLLQRTQIGQTKVRLTLAAAKSHWLLRQVHFGFGTERVGLSCLQSARKSG